MLISSCAFLNARHPVTLSTQNLFPRIWSPSQFVFLSNFSPLSFPLPLWVPFTISYIPYLVLSKMSFCMEPSFQHPSIIIDRIFNQFIFYSSFYSSLTSFLIWSMVVIFSFIVFCAFCESFCKLLTNRVKIP